MDISELQFQINKTQAVNDLKTVEGQLDKTGKAADGLIETLKNIGLTVGFGKLIKDSLQLNNQFTALSNKFNSIFSGGFDQSVFSSLKSDLSLSDTALKSILSTTGQFAKGLGQSSQYVKSFSAELTRAAANYAAFQGKTTAADVNEYARKFAKASLGEVGELKEIGIIVDNTSESFKKAVLSIQDTLGLTEAQAKQMETTKRLLEQVEIASGAASANMYDGWAQLNKVFDEFKEILGEVGQIFSTAFGPILNTLNGILEIPFVKSVAAWTIAIGGVVVGYTSLLKILNKISDSTKITSQLLSMPAEKMGEILEIQTRLLPLLEREKNLREDIANANRIKGDIHAKNIVYGKSEITNLALDVFNEEVIRLQNSFDFLQNRISPFKAEIASLGDEALKMIPEMNNLSNEFKDFVLNIGGVETATLANSAAMAANTAATLANTTSKEANSAANIFSSLTESLTSINKLIPNVVKGLGGIVGNFINVIKSGGGVKGVFTSIGSSISIFTAGLKPLLVPLAAIAAKAAALAAVFVIIADGIKGVINLISGKSFFEGTYTGKAADYLYSKTDEYKDIKARQEYVDSIGKQLKNLSDIFNQFDRDIKKIDFEDTFKKLSLKDQISKLQEEIDKTFTKDFAQNAVNELKVKSKELTRESQKLAAALQNPLKDFQAPEPKGFERRQSYELRVAELRHQAEENARKEIQAKIEANKKAQERLQKELEKYTGEGLKTNLQERDKLIKQQDQLKKQLNDINNEYPKYIANLNKQLETFSESFNYGYKDGVFGNYAEDVKKLNIDKKIKDINKELSKIIKPEIKLEKIDLPIQNIFNLKPIDLNETLLNFKPVQFKDPFANMSLGELENSKSLLEQQFKLEQEKARIELDSLVKQREAAIGNLKVMQEMIKEVVGFKSTAQSAVEATSIEAIRLQSRMYNTARSSEMAPLIEQQKQIKEIDKRIEATQKSSSESLKRIVTQLSDIAKRITSAKTSTPQATQQVQAVNPLV